MNIIYPKLQFRNTLTPLDLDNVTGIVIHHIKATAASPEEIHQWHIDNGWAGFGYNEYIRKNGTVCIGRGDFVGSHALNHNTTTYGIGCEGDYYKELYMPETQKTSLVERIKYNKSRLKNCKNIYPHSYFGSTECPGPYFPLAEILKRVEESEKKIDEGFVNCVKLLNKYGFINSPDYWINNSKYRTEYVHELIKTFANFVFTQKEV